MSILSLTQARISSAVVVALNGKLGSMLQTLIAMDLMVLLFAWHTRK